MREEKIRKKNKWRGEKEEERRGERAPIKRLKASVTTVSKVGQIQYTNTHDILRYNKRLFSRLFHTLGVNCVKCTHKESRRCSILLHALSLFLSLPPLSFLSFLLCRVSSKLPWISFCLSHSLCLKRKIPSRVGVHVLQTHTHTQLQPRAHTQTHTEPHSRLLNLDSGAGSSLTTSDTQDSGDLPLPLSSSLSLPHSLTHSQNLEYTLAHAHREGVPHAELQSVLCKRLNASQSSHTVS